MAGTTTPRKRPVARAAIRATPRSVIDASTDVEPLQFATPEPDDTAERRVIIAYLDAGTPDEYALTAPELVPPNIAMKLMKTARLRGDEMAMMQMLEEVLGEEGYDRLSNWSGLTVENIAALLEKVQRVSMGRLETPKASSRNA